MVPLRANVSPPEAMLLGKNSNVKWAEIEHATILYLWTVTDSFNENFSLPLCKIIGTGSSNMDPKNYIGPVQWICTHRSKIWKSI